MSEILQFLKASFGPLVVIFTASNLAVMGLQANVPEVIAGLKDKKTLVLILVWGWVLGPALGYLIAMVLPISKPDVVGLLLYSLAPCAPFFPMMVKRARGDMSFASDLIPVVAVFTVVLTPLMAPLLIKGVTLDIGSLVKMFLLSILLPLIIGAVIKYYWEKVASKIFPAVNLIAKLSTILTIAYAIALYWREMIATAGSFALLSMTIFMVVIGFITYRLGFGLKQNQRSVMSLGMLTRNGSVVLLAAFTIPNVDPRVITYVIMFVIWSIVIAAIAARIFNKQAGKTVAENTT